MLLTTFQIQALYWIAQAKEISSLAFKSNGLSFKPCSLLEKQGLISITDYNFHKVARIDYRGEIIVRKLEELRGQYLVIDEDKNLKLLVNLAKRLELVNVGGSWMIKDKSPVGYARGARAN
jgi:hypothetical protein